MRIIAGEFRRRLLKTPPDDTITRPIPDRVKESLFGMLSGNCVDANVFDAFAGTGAIGLEAISRGAAQCLFIERDASIAKILQANIDELGVGDRCEVMQTDALGAGALARAPRPLHLAFLDPPYPLVRDPLGFRRVMAQAAGLIQMLEPDGFLILRTPHPLLLEVGTSPAADADATGQPGKPRPGKPRRGKFGKGKKRNWREERDEATRFGSAGSPGFGAAKVDPSKFGPGATGSGKFGASTFGPGTFDGDEDPFDIDDDDVLDLDGSDGASASEDGDKDMSPEDSQAAAPKPEPIPADLSIPGAVGPETHVYHGMAVHLYARAKS